MIVETTPAPANTAEPWEDEYLADDGLLHCKTCDGARQVVIKNPFADKWDTMRCKCSCHVAEQKRQKQRDRWEVIQRNRRVCFNETNMMGWNFDNDDGRRPDLAQSAMQYAEKFQEYRKTGKGLLYMGPTGTGKTYLAACVANKVIDQGYTALMANFSDISDDLQSTWEKDEYMNWLMSFDLLIFDDLGAERKTEYMQEMVYKIIDARYRTGKPMVITTNLTPDELTKTAEISYTRIYDRILERCLPIKVEGQSRRRQAAKKDWNEMRRELGMEVHT